MVSKASFSVFLKNGTNVILPSKKYENREQGYSVLSLIDSSNICVMEMEEEKEIFTAEKEIKFGLAMFFKKKAEGDKIKIIVSGNESSLPLYSTTTVFYKK